ncbi:hypothetical protein ACN9MN_14215 [Chryseobacterium sp. S-02]|uniref:hypothetical protein n=1 Tax=Chryseobacterium sp. S-02 TaxID=3404064 RepID=UPI003CF8256C
MKKLLFIIPFVLFSCKKESTGTEMKSLDSAMIRQNAVTKADSVIKNDAGITDTITTKDIESPTEEKGNVLIKSVNGSHFPIVVQEEFTKDHDKLILKISNYSKPQLKAKILTNEKDFNIRFNQIKLPDGNLDGPFGRELTYDIPGKGEVWLIIGKNNMADGKITGAFSVKVE